jgi:hypothetical protein
MGVAEGGELCSPIVTGVCSSLLLGSSVTVANAWTLPVADGIELVVRDSQRHSDESIPAGRLPSAVLAPPRPRMNWSPMSMKAIRAPERPLSSNSKKRPVERLRDVAVLNRKRG